ncbi:MAG TPA: family 43 glycosylhydrolase [Fimbriimonas sp.]|nr:family 43 glycosylhydrolase [Fimbriimonas sp.]
MSTFALLAATLSFGAMMTHADQLKNPIVRGMAPDPSIIRVGSDYYLINSSFEYFPGVPIRHSKDLSNWKMIGHCLTTPSQLPLAGQRSSMGIFAPTIRYHDGTFYMITTNVGAGGNFLVTAKDIRGPWSERVMIAVDSIDPSLFWDDDGKCYLTVQGTGGVKQAEFDPATGKTLTDVKVIWPGTGGQWPEGPHLFKKDGWYYLTIAEGGTEYGHMQTMARSRSPWGPFEGCPFNPVLTHRSLNKPFHAIGHADFFTDTSGNWWAVCLGIRPQGYPYGHHLGRETLLLPVVWGEDGWPRLGDKGTVPSELALPASTTVNQPEELDFVGGKVPIEWSYVRNPDMARYTAAPGGGLRLLASKHTMGDVASPTWVGRPQTHLNGKLSVVCEVSGAEGGVSIRQNETHRIEVFLKEGSVNVRTTVGPLSVVSKTVPVASGACEIEVTMFPNQYEFSFKQGANSTPLGSFPTHYMSTEVGGGFTGVMLGVYATSPEEKGFVDVRSWSYVPGKD